MGVILMVAFTLVLCSGASEAEEFPTKAITLINPWAVGGGVDIAARALAKEMQEILGSPVVVESRPGSMGLIAGAYVANARPDGYIMGMFAPSEFAPEFYTPIVKATYTSKDLEPVVRWMVLPYGLASGANKPWNNLDEFTKYVQNNPKKVQVGAGAPGFSYHILYYCLAKQKNLEMIEIPFEGAGETRTALVGGHIDVGLLSLSSVQSFVEEGRLKMLAIHNPTRFRKFPNVPTFEELGYVRGFPQNLKGMWVPKGTPEGVKKKIHDVVKRAIETPSFKAFAEKNIFDPYYGSAEDLRADINAERIIIAPLIKEISEKYKK
jgi:tripartite-type tricarboxylate transporter receptor subunit TctC